MTRLQREIMTALQDRPGCYIREIFHGKYQLANSGRRSNVLKGFPMDPIFYRRTFDALLSAGLIEFGRRSYYSRQQVGWFAARSGV